MHTAVGTPTASTSAPGRVDGRTRALRLAIIGATRGTGRHLLDQALAAGHEVTALARDPARIDVRHERLRVVRGDVLDMASLAPAVTGSDAVLSSLGTTTGRAPTTLYSAGMRTIIQAMHVGGVARLIAISAAPLGRDDGDTLPMRLLLKPLMWAILKEPYTDLARMEEEMRASGLDWTIVRPPRLTDGPQTGRYRIAYNRSVRGAYTIARADLAGAVLKLIGDPTSLRAAVGIGY